MKREDEDHGDTRHASEENTSEVDPPPRCPTNTMWIRYRPPKQTLPEFLTHTIIRCNKMIVFILWVRCSLCTNSYYLHNYLVRYELLVPIYMWDNQRLEKPKYMPKVTQLIHDRTRVQTQVCLIPKPRYLPCLPVLIFCVLKASKGRKQWVKQKASEKVTLQS